MARRAVPLPISLQRRAFTVAEALELGISRRSLEGTGLVTPHYGVRQSAPSDAPSSYPSSIMLQRALTYRPRLRAGETFSHTSALLLLGTPIHVTPSIHVTIARPAGQARGKGIFGHRSLQPLPTINGPEGLPIVSPEVALVQVAASLNFRELLVAIDAFVLERSSVRPQLDLEAMRRDAQALQGPGSHRYRFALDLARKLIIEHDGEQHRADRAQYLKDQIRLNRVWQAGFRVLRLGREDFRHGKSHIARQKIDSFLEHLPRHPLLQASKYLDG